jgi:hypothetical protein
MPSAGLEELPEGIPSLILFEKRMSSEFGEQVLCTPKAK